MNLRPPTHFCFINVQTFTKLLTGQRRYSSLLPLSIDGLIYELLFQPFPAEFQLISQIIYDLLLEKLSGYRTVARLSFLWITNWSFQLIRKQKKVVRIPYITKFIAKFKEITRCTFKFKSKVRQWTAKKRCEKFSSWMRFRVNVKLWCNKRPLFAEVRWNRRWKINNLYNLTTLKAFKVSLKC